MNLVHGPTCHECFVAQWLEHLTSVWKVIQVVGLIPVGDSDFSLSCTCDMLITVFLISSTSLKFTIFLYLSKEIPYYWPHAFWVTSQYCSSQNDLVLRSSMYNPKIVHISYSHSLFLQKIKRQEENHGKKKHTYYLFVFFLTVHLVFHTSHEVPF